MRLAEKYMPLAKAIAYRVAPDYHDKEELEGVALLALCEVVAENTHGEAQIVEHIKLRVRGAVLNFISRDSEHLTYEVPMPEDGDLDHLYSWNPHETGSDINDRLRDAVSKLPEDSQRLVKMHYYEGMTQREIADVLGLTQQAISAQLRGVAGKLREML